MSWMNNSYRKDEVSNINYYEEISESSDSNQNNSMVYNEYNFYKDLYF
jgi:hypothetical protein